MAEGAPDKDSIVDYDFGPTYPERVDAAAGELGKRIVESGLGVFRTQDDVTELLAILPANEAEALAEAGSQASKDTVPPVTYEAGQVAVSAVQSVRVRYRRV